MPMLASTLNSLLLLKRIKPAELARRSGISRQAISKWFKLAEHKNLNQINAEWNTVQKIAAALKIEPALLSKDFFGKLTTEQKENYRTLLLWDRSYESMESFTIALAKKEYKAIGRYVQVFGILAAEKIFGSWIFKKFDQYAPFIHPVRRKEIKNLCQNLQQLNLI